MKPSDLCKEADLSHTQLPHFLHSPPLFERGGFHLFPLLGMMMTLLLLLFTKTQTQKTNLPRVSPQWWFFSLSSLVSLKHWDRYMEIKMEPYGNFSFLLLSLSQIENNTVKTIRGLICGEIKIMWKCATGLSEAEACAEPVRGTQSDCSLSLMWWPRLIGHFFFCLTSKIIDPLFRKQTFVSFVPIHPELGEVPRAVALIPP